MSPLKRYPRDCNKLPILKRASKKSYRRIIHRLPRSFHFQFSFFKLVNHPTMALHGGESLSRRGCYRGQHIFSSCWVWIPHLKQNDDPKHDLNEFVVFVQSINTPLLIATICPSCPLLAKKTERDATQISSSRQKERHFWGPERGILRSPKTRTVRFVECQSACETTSFARIVDGVLCFFLSDAA